jgi:hypothetical protein
MKTRAWWFTSIALLLFGCGGGGSGSSGSGASGPTYATLATLSSSTTFATVAVASTYYRLPDAETPTITAVGATVTAEYNPASSTYTLTGSLAGSTTQVSQTFGPAALQNGSYSITNTGSDGTTVVGTLFVSQSLSPYPGGTQTNYSYAGYGQWGNGSTSSTFVQDYSDYNFTYGIGTQPGDLPRTGTVTYNLLLTGTPDPSVIVGTGTLTADFTAGTVSVSLSPGIDDLVDTEGVTSFPPFVTLTGSGTINLTSNGFNFAITGAQYSGQLNGLFYGPQGAEVGAAFTANPTGSFIGAVQAAGVALGKKS